MKSIQKHIIYAGIIILIINLINLLFNFLNKSAFPPTAQMLSMFGWTVYFTVGLYAVNLPVGIWIQKRFPGLGLKIFLKRFISGMIGSFLVSLFFGSILYVLMQIFTGQSFQEAVQLFSKHQSSQLIQFLIWFSLTVAAIFQINSLINDYQSEQLKKQKQKVNQIATKHESLKSQISSHFLFNSLNVLTGLIDENPQKAQEFVADLSSVYRYVLEQKDKEWVNLNDEIDFCGNYMELIQKRYEEGIHFETIEKIPTGYLIAPLSLQILIENCIKHNRISSEEPLYIKVNVEDGYLTISNNLQPKKQVGVTTGKGLEHILNRYADFERQVRIYRTEDEFIVKIPLINKTEIKMEINKKYTEEEYQQAKERVEEIQGFYWNLASYIVVNAFLTFLDLKKDGVYNWAFAPLIGWGIGLSFHAINVFGLFNSSDWKDRMIQKELEKSKRERDYIDNKF